MQKGQSFHCKSIIHNLDPYLDQDGILRVGGRIERAAMTQNEKHPIILPRKHHFTTLLIRSAHMKTFHGGYALTAQKLQQSLWIVNARVAIKSVLYRCTTCFRLKKKLLIQKMGDLPAYRLNVTIPFTFVGVDYAGYFEVKSSNRRNAPYVKGYVSVFVCLTTRAVHLEVVSDLSTIQFMKAFKRFIGRRGIPSRVYSDNGTNFVGAAREIQTNLNQMIANNDSEFNQYLLNNRIK